MSSVAVLLVQLGTPDAPTTPALRRYLRQFLGDPRVIEVPRLKWWFILNLFILPFRPSRSAAKYQRIWSPQTGSPLLHWTRRQTEALQQLLPNVPVRFGMQIGNPPVAEVLRELIGQGIERLVVLPMYPQYSATTTASATDVLFQALMKERRVPALRIVPPYYEHPAYLDAMTAVIQEDLSNLSWQPDHYVLNRAPRLAARQVDAEFPVAFRTRRVAEALHRESAGRAGEVGREEGVRRDAGLHRRLPGDDRRDRLRGARGVPARGG
jgi:protoporphyrin/coproporphyrin ferrochelatase